MVAVYIGVGSNIDPEENIPRALRLLATEVPITAVSTFFRTIPFDRPEQSSFYNGVVRITTDIPPAELKDRILRAIETRLGRKRTADRSSARTIDLDILLYGDRVITGDGLNVPDPLIIQRSFLAVPLLELASDLVLPDSGRTLDEVVRAMPAGDLTPLEDFSRALKKEVLHEP